MAKRKGGMSSPFTNSFGATVSDKGKAGDTMDRNICGQFSDPHSKGPNTMPNVFFTGVNGKEYHGSVDKIAADVVSSTMQGNKKK